MAGPGNAPAYPQMGVAGRSECSRCQPARAGIVRCARSPRGRSVGRIRSGSLYGVSVCAPGAAVGVGGAGAAVICAAVAGVR
jgi:hypothetical protein